MIEAKITNVRATFETTNHLSEVGSAISNRLETQSFGLKQVIRTFNGTFVYEFHVQEMTTEQYASLVDLINFYKQVI